MALPRPMPLIRATALGLALTAVGAHGVAQAQVAGADAITPVGGAQLARPGVVVSLTAGVPAPPAMPMLSYVVADMDTGDILAAKAAHTRMLPASTLKTLTALTLLPRLPARLPIRATDADANADGTRVGVLPGTQYTAGMLFHGLLMASGNDAAYALARTNGGIPQTLAQMNAEAERLGAFDTVAGDPGGLDQPGQTSSAYDLALIGRAAMRLGDFRRIVTTRQLPFPGGRRADGKVLPGFMINNHNRLLYNYPGTIGIKNGYTFAARHTFIGAATRSGKTYLVAEMAGATGSWRPTAALLDWAFTNGAKVTPVGTLVEPGTATRPPPAAALSQAPATGPAPSATAAPQTAGTPAASAARAASARAASARGPAIRVSLGGVDVPLGPWVGVAGLVGALALLGVLARRALQRHRT